MDEIKQQLGYKPNIKYSENYYSNSEQSNDSTLSSIDTSPNNLDTTIDYIDNSLQGLPNDLGDIIAEVYEPIKNLYNDYLKDKDILEVPSYKKPIINTNPNNNPDDSNNSNNNTNTGSDTEQNNKNAKKIILNKNLIILKVGEQRQLTYKIIPPDATNQDVYWESEDETTATVTDGLVVGVKEGTCKVSVSLIDTNKKAFCKVIVISESSSIITPPSDEGTQDNSNITVSRVELSKNYLEIYIEDKYQLTATVYPLNATNNEVIWESTDEEIATVDNGLVTGVTKGQCKVTVTTVDGNKKDTCYVTVKEKNNYDEDLTPSTPEKDPDLQEDDEESLWEVGEIPTVEIETTDPRDIVPKEFIKNIYDLINYYISGLSDAINKYYYQVLKMTMDLDNNQIKLLFKNISEYDDFIKIQYQHLFDLSLKNERVSSVKINYLENSFNINQTVLHIQSFLATYEMRKKYINIKYLDNYSKSSSEANLILKGTNKDYDLKYDKTYFNLFRYVNSSLKVTSDTLNSITQGYKAKELLIKKGGIK